MGMIYNSVRNWGLSIFIGIMGLILCQTALAETNTDSLGKDVNVSELATEKVGKDASELLVQINKNSELIKRYSDKAKSASEEDLLVLQLQIVNSQQQVVDDVYQLSDSLLEQEKEGPQIQLRKQVEGVLSDIIPRIWVQIRNLRDEIDKIRAGRVKASSDEMLTIEEKLSHLTDRLNNMFQTGLAHIENMEKVGMKTTEARNKLTELIADRADELSGRILLALKRIDAYNVRIKETPDDADIAKLLIASAKTLDTNTASMDVILGLMETLKMETNVYRAQLVEATRDISTGLMNTGVAVSLVNRAIERVNTWFMGSGLKFFMKLLIFFGIIVVFVFVKRLAEKGLARILNASNLNLSKLAYDMILSSTSKVVMILGILIALSQLGISLGPLLAGLGVAGFIIGFALQDTLSNFASGIMILLYRPYDVGDLIDVGGVFGKAEKMNLVSTTILTLDNQVIVIPNNKIWGDVIKNITAQEIRRVDMVFGIAYSDDISKAEGILNSILESADRILEDPEPMVRLHTLGASSVDFIVRPWVKVDDYWDVYWEVTRAVKVRFDEENVSIPFPQQDVHLYHENMIEAPPTEPL